MCFHTHAYQISYSPVVRCFLCFRCSAKCRMDYKHCFIAHRNQPSQQSLTNCIDSHNAYVQQLHTTNAMLAEYYSDTLPTLMVDLEEIYTDLYQIATDVLYCGSDIMYAKVNQTNTPPIHMIQKTSQCSWVNHIFRLAIRRSVSTT